MSIVHEEALRALYSLVEIKKAIEDFDQGDSNLFDALDRIRAALLPAKSSERDVA
jgi:hypothetical protein